MKHILFSGVMLVSAFIQAQENPHIYVRANVKEDRIQLRWAVNSAMAWKQSNTYGFIVERYTVMRNNEVLQTPDKVVLTPQPLKPQPLDNWKTLATADTYAAVIAQALYGKDFSLTDVDTKGVSKLIALSQELEQRYYVSMYAADLSYSAALMAGWGFEDKTVKPGERYLYRISSSVPKKTINIEMGSVYIGMSEKETLPQPQELTALFGDRSVLLTWNYGALSNIYNAYYLERSLDGKTFSRISDIPLTNMNSKNGKPVERMIYTDSLRQNEEQVYYRLVGITTFSEQGPPSDTVSGKGITRLIYVPHITRAVPDEKGILNVDWEFDERGNEQIKHFELHQSESANGPFAIVKTNIDRLIRSTQFSDLLSSNYFVIAAVPNHGEPVSSFPVLVQPTDSIPPSIPVGLTGIIDSLGIVKLSWKKNEDKDIYGYRIYRAQNAKEEMIPLTDNAILSTSYVDTIEVKNLNTKVYYAVSALDKRYNQSKKSDIAIIQKPDLVPPTAPLITKYKVVQGKIQLEWATGNEDNLASIELYRNEQGAKEIKLYKKLSLDQRSFSDSLFVANTYYQYSLAAVSQGGLRSDYSPSVLIQAPDVSAAKRSVELEAKFIRKSKAVQLSWNDFASDIKQVEIYKRHSEGEFALLKVVKGFEKQSADADIQQGKSYEYMIRLIKEGGRSAGTATSNMVKIN